MPELRTHEKRWTASTSSTPHHPLLSQFRQYRILDPAYSLLFATQRKTTDFWRTIDPDTFVSRKSAADVHDRVTDLERSRSVQHTVLTWRNNRSNDWQSDLSAVIVASKNQIEVEWLGPFDLVWSVR